MFAGVILKLKRFSFLYPIKGARLNTSVVRRRRESNSPECDTSCAASQPHGSKLSHPATIGSRVYPQNKYSSRRSAGGDSEDVSEISSETQPNEPKPRLSTCGSLAMRSTLSGVTNASTDAVPRMNMSAMIGAEIQTER